MRLLTLGTESKAGLAVRVSPTGAQSSANQFSPFVCLGTTLFTIFSQMFSDLILNGNLDTSDKFRKSCSIQVHTVALIHVVIV